MEHTPSPLYRSGISQHPSWSYSWHFGWAWPLAFWAHHSSLYLGWQLWVNIDLKEAHNKKMLLILYFFIHLADRLFQYDYILDNWWTKSRTQTLPFWWLTLDLFILILNCGCLSELLEKLFVAYAGASTDQWNQNL